MLSFEETLFSPYCNVKRVIPVPFKQRVSPNPIFPDTLIIARLKKLIGPYNLIIARTPPFRSILIILYSGTIVNINPVDDDLGIVRLPLT